MRRWTAMILAALMVAGGLPLLAVSAVDSNVIAPDSGTPSGASGQAESSPRVDVNWRQKVDPTLLASGGDPTETVEVFVAATDARAVRRAMGMTVGSAPPTNAPFRVPHLSVPRNAVPKVAALPEVLAVLPYSVPEAPTPPDDIWSVPYTPPDYEPAMRDVIGIQGAAEAWSVGYTGAGVQVMIMDTGVDFGHPDLNGTQARDTNISSPYYGWPIAFDSLSMMSYLNTGNAYPAVNTWYSDTSTTDTDIDSDGFLDTTGLNVTGIVSASGTYHLGFHPDVRLQNRVGSNVRVMVVDSMLPGFYDTVYTDLDNDGNMSEEWPARWGDEVATLDVNGDGMADRSAGMVYFMANGATPIPYSDVIAAEYGIPLRIPTNGDLVAFAINDAVEPGGTHGTLCASAVAAQGVIGGGVVQGMAPDAKIIATGNVYTFGGNWYDYFFFAAEGYDGVPGTGDEANILSGSFGDSGTIRRGWEYDARLVTNITVNYAPHTTYVIAAGNGGYGYGTVVTPGAGPAVITVGAATSFRTPGPATYSTWGDVIPWSDRGPSPFGQLEPDVVSVGSQATGDITVNQRGNANTAWSYWAGTSLATPVTAGVVALTYDAYVQGRGRLPESLEMRDIIMSTADDLRYDVFIQGAGLANASRSTAVAAGLAGIRVSPSGWNPGGFRGQEAASFARNLFPGDSDDVVLTITNEDPLNGTTVNVSDRAYERIFEQTTVMVADRFSEDGFQNGRPDYVVPLIDKVNSASVIPPNADHIRVSFWLDFADFDPDNDFVQENRFTMSVYDWWDLDGDGEYWNDTNGDGLAQSAEWDASEIAMTSYSSQVANTLEVRVGNPWGRIHDGLIVGIFHTQTTWMRVYTNISVRVEAYEAVDDPWLSTNQTVVALPPGGSAQVLATASVPPGTPIGFYEGAFVLQAGNDTTTLPVAISVASDSPEFEFGGTAETTLYRNGQLFGGVNWGWRPESGDWRYYFVDVPDTYPLDQGSQIIANVSWEGMPTDVDVFILGNASDGFSDSDPNLFGPYTMGIRGRSQNMYVGGGKFLFQTVTGGPQEIITADLGYGLNEIALHNVLNSGTGPVNNLTGQIGVLSASPSPWDLGVVTDFSLLNGSRQFDLSTTVSLPGVEVRSYGVSALRYLPSETVLQDNPFDASTASWSTQFDVYDGGLIDVNITSPSPVDIDLYVLRDTNGNGVPDWGTEVVASSTSPTADERVTLQMPANGTYWVFVHGWSVPGGSASFSIYLDVIQGTDLQVMDSPQGPLAKDVTRYFNASHTIPATEGKFRGIIFVGPPMAPGALVIRFYVEVVDNAPEFGGLMPPPGSVVADERPRVGANVTDTGSGVNYSTLRLLLDGADITSWATVTPESIYWDPIFLLPQGPHSVEVSAEDMGGNANGTQWFFAVDTVPPILAWTDPPDGLLTNEPLLSVLGSTEPGATLLVNGIPAAVGPNGSFSTSVALAEGPNLVTLTVSDALGNAASESRTVFLDTMPPVLVWTDPPDGLLTNQLAVTVRGSTEPGASLLVNGLPVAVGANGSYETTVALTEGANPITIVVSDGLGNAAVRVRTVLLDTVPPPLTVTPPPSPMVTLTSENVVHLYGLSEPGATVIVNSMVLTAAANGSFDVYLALPEGQNDITVTARDAAGNENSALVVVVVDSQPPALMWTDPSDGLLTSAPSQSVTGSTEPGASLWVNGVPTTVGPNGSFATSVALSEGPNLITVTVSDGLGNEATESRTVFLDTAPPLLSWSEPSDGLLTSQTAVTVAGRTEAGASVSVNGVPALVGADGSFWTTVSLLEGANPIAIEVSDALGNAATESRSVTLDTVPPPLAIASPADGTLTNVRAIGLDGTSEPYATVIAGGLRVVADAAGSFEMNVPLLEGSNVIAVVARDAAGNENSTSVTVVVDTQPPVANAGPNALVEAGTAVTLDATLSTDNDRIVSYSWYVEDVGGTVLRTGDFVSYAFSEPGVYEVRLVVTDAAGNKDSDAAVAVVTPAGDLDRDFLPDAWEEDNFGGTGLAPGDDPDLDGATNLQEYTAGTDPMNPDTDGDTLLDGADADPLVPRVVPTDWTWLLLAIIVVLGLLVAYLLLRGRGTEGVGEGEEE